MINKTILFFLIILTIQSCKYGTSKIYSNDGIDRDNKEQIKLMNDKLYKAIISNNVDLFKSVLSDMLIDKGKNNLEKLVYQLNSSFQSDSYRVLDEYYVQNEAVDIVNNVPSCKSTYNDYTITYKALNKDMYVSLLLPNGLVNDLLIIAIYGKYEKEWKLNILQFGQYSFYGKTSPELYKLAKESYKKSHLIDAFNYLRIAKICLKPAKEYFQYNIEKEIYNYFDSIVEEVNNKYHFPVTINNIDSKPIILDICPESVPEGIFPMVYYLTKVNLNDTLSLKKEYEKIKIEVHKLFPGVDTDKKYVFYSASNEFPDINKPIERYGFIDERK